MARKRRPDDFDLRAAIRRREFTPASDDAPAIVALVATGDEDDAKHGAATLLRIPEAAVRAASAALRAADDESAVRLCRLLARLPADSVRAPLVATLSGGSSRARRAAAIALGKVPGPGVADALVEALASADPPLRRAIVEALGKVSDERAREVLETMQPGEDAELARLLERARLLHARDASRVHAVALDRAAVPPSPLAVELRCRSGLESVLEGELAGLAGVALVRRVARGRLRLELSAAPAVLDGARTWFEIRFLLPTVSGDDLAGTIVATLTSRVAREVFATFTRGEPRLRIDFDDAGKQRALTFAIAARLAAAGLINDPREAPWEARIARHRDGSLEIALVPRGFDDPRFAYRLADVPAASHPTIAAALARLAGVEPDDVVWDPFTGSGAELIERGRLGSCRKLYGTDTDPRALEAAARNLEAASLSAELVLQDATTFVPAVAPTLVISNPPMGRRVHRGDVSPLLARIAAQVVRVTSPRARIAWLDPTPDAVAAVLERGGFALRRTLPVDLGGFEARFELWRRG